MAGCFCETAAVRAFADVADQRLTKDSGVDAFQVKSVSESRFVRYIGLITNPQLDNIASAVAMCKQNDTRSQNLPL